MKSRRHRAIVWSQIGMKNKNCYFHRMNRGMVSIGEEMWESQFYSYPFYTTYKWEKYIREEYFELEKENEK